MTSYILDVTSVSPLSKNKPLQAIVLCHGYGGDGKDISTLAINWRRFLPDAIFLCPNAPEVCADREFCAPGISAAISAIDGVVFAGHMDGHIRAYNSTNGSIIWDYDTVHKYDSVSGIEGYGGSMGGSGPLPYKGNLYLSSGYGLYGHMPGNVLIAFGKNKSTD